MIKIQRLSEDSSWHLQWDKISLIIDPWLVGEEVDGFRWLNEQRHVIEPVGIDQLPSYDAIVVSQSYEDHCHTPTLAALDDSKEILCVPKAYQKLRKKLQNRRLINLTLSEPLDYAGYRFWCFKPRKLLDPIYYAILITNSRNEGIFYSPHGFELNKDEVSLINQFQIKLLITTFTEFDLPAYLGGKVNPGLNNVQQLRGQVSPEVILNTHDEEKLMKGLVARKASVKYADYENLPQSIQATFRHIKGYDPVIFA